MDEQHGRILELAASSGLRDYALEQGNQVLAPFGETDALLFYGIVAQSLARTGFLKGKPLASKIWIPQSPGSKFPTIVKRGSLSPPLEIRQMARAVDLDFLRKRKGRHLKDARGGLSAGQALAWEYFPPRKLCDFLYATNGEDPGKPIERIFIDIDRGEGVGASKTLEAVRALEEVVADDADFQAFAKKFLSSRDPFLAWTGRSFHAFFFCKKPQPDFFYLKHFQHERKNPQANFIGRWAEAVGRAVKGVKVLGGHEKQAGAITMDPSQTPSGKLCRVPLGSLHMADAGTVDGVSIPLESGMLGEKNLLGELEAFTPQKVVEELPMLQKRLPKL